MKWTILTLLSIFICICCAQMLEWDQAGNLIAHSYSIWGDWSAHFTFISNLLNRGTHWISGDNPAFFGMPFQYPFLSHLFTAIIAFLTRMSVVHSTYYTSLALLFALPFVLFYFFNAIGLTVRQSILSIILFLFLGGLQAYDPSLSVSEPFTNQFKSGSIFTQMVLFELFPQRAFLFGLIFLLGGLGFGFQKIKTSQFSKKHFWGLSIYLSFLSWIHIHSWIAMGAILLFYFIFSWKQKQSLKILAFGITVAFFSTPLLGFLLLRNHPAVETISWQKWYPGWAQNPSANLPAAEQMNPIVFWIYNTGLFFPLAAIGKLLLWKRKIKILESPVFILATAGSLLFIIAVLINVQPYFYDNLKLFTYAFLLLSPFAAIGLDALFQKKYLIPVAVILIAVQSYTAIQDYLFFYEQKQTATFLTKEEFELAEQFKILRHSADSLVLITPKHNHWIPTITGNPVLMGYPGWLWSWGISYGAREAEVNEVLTGGSRAQEILSRYPVEYIVVNEQEMAGNQPVSISYLRAHYPILMERGLWHVFSVNH